MTFIPFEALRDLEGVEIAASVMTTDSFRNLPSCRNLRRVNLSALSMDGRITQIAAQCPLLEELNLGSSKLVTRDFLPLIRLKRLKTLQWIEGTIAEEEGLDVFGNIETLESLTLEGLNIPGAKLSFLPRLRKVTNLRLLGVTKLSKSGWTSVGAMPALKIVSLSSSNITDDDLRVFSGNRVGSYVAEMR